MDPHVLIPLNDPPENPYSVVPWGSGLQVTGEDKHFDSLSAYVTGEGRGLLLVTMHRSSELKGKSTVEFVEIRVDGRRVGQMTAASSAHFFPVIDHLEKSNLTAAAWAHIKGSGLAAEVVLQAAKASEIDRGWLTGEPVTVPKLVPVAAAYRVPKAYVPQSKSTGRGPGAAPSQATSSGQVVTTKQPAKSGCGMVVAGFAAIAALATVPESGPVLSLGVAGVCLALLVVTRAVRDRRGA